MSGVLPRVVEVPIKRVVYITEGSQGQQDFAARTDKEAALMLLSYLAEADHIVVSINDVGSVFVLVPGYPPAN